MADQVKLWQALAEVQRLLIAVPKEGKAPDNIGGYNYRKFDDLLAAYHHAAVTAGILCIPHDVHAEWTIHNGPKRQFWLCQIEMEWQFIHAESGENLTVKTKGWALDGGDKALPKARTSAHKELISRMFSIPFDNPDIDNDGLDVESGEPVLSPPTKQGGSGGGSGRRSPKPKPKMITPDTLQTLKELRSELDEEGQDSLRELVLEKYGVTAPTQLTEFEAMETIKEIEAMIYANTTSFEEEEIQE